MKIEDIDRAIDLREEIIFTRKQLEQVDNSAITIVLDDPDSIHNIDLADWDGDEDKSLACSKIKKELRDYLRGHLTKLEAELASL